jgi:hypothetical protein
VGFALGDLPDLCVFWLCCCWSVLGRFGGVLLALYRVLLPCRLCFGVFSIPGAREVTKALWNACCAAAAATGLTGSVHRSDRRRPSV